MKTQYRRAWSAQDKRNATRPKTSEAHARFREMNQDLTGKVEPRPLRRLDVSTRRFEQEEANDDD